MTQYCTPCVRYLHKMVNQPSLSRLHFAGVFGACWLEKESRRERRNFYIQMILEGWLGVFTIDQALLESLWVLGGGALKLEDS